MSKKSLSTEEIVNELDEWFANSESEEEDDDFDAISADLEYSVQENVSFDKEMLKEITPEKLEYIDIDQALQDFEHDMQECVPSQSEFLLYSPSNIQSIPQPSTSNVHLTTSSISVTPRTPKSKSRKKVVPKPLLHPLKWKKANNFEPKIHKFNNNQNGIQMEEFGLSEESPIIDFFEAFVTHNLMGKIVFETNRYAQEQLASSQISTRLARWKDTTIEELYVFFSLTMLMARNKKLEIQEYWSSNELLYQPIFGKTMSRDRYILLLRFIHFCDNSQQVRGDRLHKIQMVISDIQKNFKDALIPFSNLAIDESLLLWKGRLSFKQYIKTKRHRFGIKLYIICDCETDFILNFTVYTGANEYNDPLQDQLRKSGVIVKDLMKPYFHKGHSLYTDNFYTSPKLAMFLHKKKVNTCGTVRQNRKCMPPMKTKLQMGEREAHCTDKLLAIHWKDRRDVYMLTTMNKDKMVDTKKIDRVTGRKYLKPECVIKYNSNMGAVDKTDMLLSSVECVRRTMKWYKKLFFHILDMCLLNAYSAYKTVTGEHISLAKFQLTLISEIMKKYGSWSKVTPSKGKKNVQINEDRLQPTAKHFPEPVPQAPSGKPGRKYCYVCSHKSAGKKRKDSMYYCKDCGVGLCVFPCFKIYHTQKEF